MRERKRPIISANDRTAIFRAAAELELYANELRIAYTLDGQWGASAMPGATMTDCCGSPHACAGCIGTPTLG